MFATSRRLPLVWLAAAGALSFVLASNSKLATAATAAGSKKDNRRRVEEEELAHSCRRVASFKRISQMEELVEKLERVLERNAFEARSKFLAQSSMLPCLRQASAILDLGELVRERENVCTNAHLNKMEAFIELHLKRYAAYRQQKAARRSASGSGGGGGGPIEPVEKPITGKFFELYANQVSFTCKANLLLSLKTIDAHQVSKGDDYTNSLPWLSYANSKICKRIEQQELLASKLDAQQVFDSNSSGFTKKEIRQCKAVRALAEISTIHELVEAFERDEQSYAASYNQGEGEEEGHQPADLEAAAAAASNLDPHVEQEDELDEEKSGIFLIVPPDQVNVVKEMLETCSRLRPIYEETVRPIVRLARLGFNPTFDNFDKVCSENKLLQRWFGITLVCSSVLSSQLTDINKYKDLKKEFEAKKSLVVIDEDPEDETAANGAESRPASSAPINVLSLLRNPIEDELWVYKYGTTKLQRFKDSLLKKVFRLFKVEDIDDHIVFRRHVRGINGWIVKVVILAVSLLILK